MALRGKFSPSKVTAPSKGSQPNGRAAGVYKFTVREPWGTSVINGYRRAARHFGLHTRNDPTAEVSDSYRLLVHREAGKLRQVAAALTRLDADDPEFELNELEVLTPVNWFWHHWRKWDKSQDEGALGNLAWKRTIIELKPGVFRVTIKGRLLRARTS
jgi:hypothetical protein